MPDLNLLPVGASVFVDTNIFYYHFTGRSPSCTVLFRRIAFGEVTGYVNTEVLSDLLHKLMLYEAHRMRYIPNCRACDLKARLLADRTTIAHMPGHQTLFEQVLNIGIKMLGVSKRLLVETKRERATHGLMTNDSLHLGSMLYHRTPLVHIATRDGDFAHIHDITVWQPEDVV